MIYTSYFGNLKNIGDEMVPIAICGKSPNWYHGPEYKKLAPKYKFFMEWKENHDNSFYIEHFNTEVLNCLNPDTVVSELEAIRDDVNNCEDIVLLCYEKPGDFCHRHIVADWLNEHEIPCEEL